MTDEETYSRDSEIINLRSTERRLRAEFEEWKDRDMSAYAEEMAKLRAALAEAQTRIGELDEYKRAAETCIFEHSTALAEAEQERDAVREDRIAAVQRLNDLRGDLARAETDLAAAERTNADQYREHMACITEQKTRAERAEAAVLRYRCQVDALEQLGVAAHKAWTEKLERAEADIAAAREVIGDLVHLAWTIGPYREQHEFKKVHQIEKARAFFERTATAGAAQ